MEQRANLLLWIFSFFFWGAAFFSVALSFLIIKKRPRPKGCCTCGCTWIHILGWMEMASVFSAFLTSTIIDGSYISYPPSYQMSFTLLIALPTAVGGILCCGLPRVLIARAISAEKEHADEDLEREPLTRNQQQQQPPRTSSAPLYYQPAHPNVPYGGSPVAMSPPPQQHHHQQPQQAPPPGYHFAASSVQEK